MISDIHIWRAAHATIWATGALVGNRAGFAKYLK
jgi:hypothetical protein